MQKKSKLLLKLLEQRLKSRRNTFQIYKNPGWDNLNRDFYIDYLFVAL